VGFVAVLKEVLLFGKHAIYGGIVYLTSVFIKGHVTFFISFDGQGNGNVVLNLILLNLSQVHNVFALNIYCGNQKN